MKSQTLFRLNATRFMLISSEGNCRKSCYRLIKEENKDYVSDAERVKLHSCLIHVRVFGFDSLILARLGRNYKCRTEPIHISYRDLQTILSLKLEHTVGDSCLLKWRKCVFLYILLFLCQLEPITLRERLVSTMFRLTSTCSFFLIFQS